LWQRRLQAATVTRGAWLRLSRLGSRRWLLRLLTREHVRSGVGSERNDERENSDREMSEQFH
jgi:hypothetical protein